MANINSTKNGNWSDATVWSTSALPASADDVYLFHVVTANINTKVNTIYTGSNANTGFLILIPNVSLSANVFVNQATFDISVNNAFVQYSQVFPAQTELVGNIYGNAPRVFLRNSSSGTVTIRGNIYSQSIGYIFYAPSVYNAGILNVRGNINGAPFAGGFQGNQLAGVSTVQNVSVINVFGTVYSIDDPTYAGNQSIVPGIDNTGANAVVNVVGRVQGQRGGTDASRFTYGIRNTGTNSVVNITGGVVGGGINCYAIYNNSSTGVINLYGSVSGGTGTSTIGIYTNAGRVHVFGESRGGSGSGSNGVYNNSNTGYVFVRKAVGNGFGAGSAGAPVYPAVGSASGLNNAAISGICMVESMECGPRGAFPVTGIIYLSAGTGTNATFTNGSNQTITLFLPGSASTYTPSVSDVRLGVVYDEFKKTGTLAMPLTSQVNFGVPVDDASGGAVFDSNAVFTVKPSNLRLQKNSVGERISFVPTIEQINNIINNLT